MKMCGVGREMKHCAIKYQKGQAVYVKDPEQEMRLEKKGRATYEMLLHIVMKI